MDGPQINISINTDIKSVADLPPAIEGRAAWHSADFTDGSWIEQLSDADNAEIKSAAEAALNRAGGDIAKITKEAFPLPTMSARISAVSDEIQNGRGFALLRGIPVEEWGTELSAAAFYGVGAHIGKARSQNAKGHILGHVRDLGRSSKKA